MNMRGKTEDVVIGLVAVAILWILAGIAPHVFNRGRDEDISRIGALLTALPFIAAGIGLVIYALRYRRRPRGLGGRAR